MGQYHHPVCPDAEEGFDPHDVGCGLKAAEQLFTRPGSCAALVALVSARGGNMSADLSQSPLIGRWAGKRVLIQGDYAEDGDIPGWSGPALSMLYRAIRDPEGDGEETGQLRYANISQDVAAFLEGACSIRFFGDGWRGFVKVKPVAKKFGGCGIAEYVLDDKRSFERC